MSKNPILMFLSVMLTTYINWHVASLLLISHLMLALFAWTIWTYFGDLPVWATLLFSLNGGWWGVTQFNCYHIVKQEMLRQDSSNKSK